MDHEIHTPISVDLTTAVSNGGKKTYSPPRLIPLASTDVESGNTSYIPEGTAGAGLLNTQS